jgi:hypothetical protein
MPLKSYILGATLYGLSILFIKFGIVLEWLRIFNPKRIKNGFYWGSWIILAINLVFYVSAAFILLLACKPFSKLYNPFLKGTCYDPSKLFVAAGPINLAVDVMILLLPCKIIWELQIPTKKKLGLAATFAFGLL